MKGLFHAHVGWIFIHTQRGNKERFAPDLIKDPVISWVDRTFIYWAILGLLLPFFLGWIIGGTVVAGLTGLLWGGLVRVFVLHHFTYSINSLCHTFGRREFETTDESRNLALIAIPTLGEAYHNSHHAFPTSATHGLRWYQVDISSLVINGLEKVGLAWDVVRVTPERQASKAAAKTA
jgi:stearoyl-CoA desaturase (delta-9 desaturase)